MKQLMKTNKEGIIKIPDPGKVDFGEMIIKEDLFKKGIDPKTITSETQLDTILNTPHTPTKPKKMGEVIDVDFGKNWPEKKAHGGIAGMLGERTNYSDGGNGEDDSMVGISMSIEERWERIKKLLKQMEDIKSGKTTDPNPEDKATGGRIGTGLNYLLGEDDQNMRVPYGEGSTTQDDFNQYLKDRSQRDKEERRKKFEKDFEDWKKWKETEGGTVNWAAEGGRIGYAAGGMGRRAFLKLMAALGATGVAAKSGLATLFKGGAKTKALTSVPIGNAAGMPAWFKPLVNKVIKQGDDITKKAATNERQIVHKDVLPDGDEVTVTQHLDNGNVDVSVAGKDNPWLSKTGHGEQPYNISYIKGETIIVKNKKPIKVKDKMETDEGYTYQTGPDRTDVDIDFDFVNFTEKTTKHDTSVLNSYATGKKIKSKKTQPLEDMSPEGDWDDSLDFASGGRVPLGKGGIAGMLGE